MLVLAFRGREFGPTTDVRGFGHVMAWMAAGHRLRCAHVILHRPFAVGGIRPECVIARRDGGDAIEFDVVVRIDPPGEAEYYRHGGILQYVLRGMARNSRS